MIIDPLSIQYPYDECQTINQLQAYNTWKHNDERLDLLREIQYSGNYYWQGIAIPGSVFLTSGVPAKATINGVSVIPPGTYVTSITHYHSQPEAFRIKLYDKGSKASIFYGDYSHIIPIGSNMSGSGIYGTPPSDPGSNADLPFGPGYFMSPFIITGPGVIGWELVNASPNTNVIQLMLSCAVPITNRSIGNKVVSKG